MGFDVSDSGSDFEGGFAKKIANKATKPPPKKLGTSDDLFDSMMADDDKPTKPAPTKKAPKKAAPKKAAAPKAPKAPKAEKKKAAPKKKKDSGSEDDAPKPKKAKAAPKKKKTFDSDDMSGSDFDMSNMEPARDRPGRGKKTVNYGGGNSESEADSDF